MKKWGIWVVAPLMLFCGADVASAKDYVPETKELSNKEAEKFVENLANDAFNVVRTKNISSEDVKKEFDSLLKSWFWLGRIAKFTIGTSFKNLNKEEQEKVINDYLPKDLYKQFLSKFSDYKTSEFKVTGSRKKSSTQVEVNSVLKAEKAMKIVWTVRLTQEGSVKVYDATYEGISCCKTLKSVYENRMGKRSNKDRKGLQGKELFEKLWEKKNESKHKDFRSR